MKRSLRSAAKRAGSPLLGPLDRRLAELTEVQRKELERIDERLEIDLRILDEHLLAIRRATRRIAADALTDAVGDALERSLSIPDALVLVAPPGSPIVVPDGFEVDDQVALGHIDESAWTPDHAVDDLETLRVVRLRRR